MAAPACRRQAEFALEGPAERRFGVIADDAGIDRFQGVPLAPGPCGTALIDHALACFVCRPRSARKVGDHVLFMAEIVSYRMNQGEPLVFHAGGFAGISAACPR